MPSVRSWILLAVGIFVLVMVLELLSLRQTPDSKGFGRDSYGTRVSGYRGVYETLEELGVRVERQLAPPTPAGISVLVFLNPSLKLGGVEPVYLQDLRPWIEAGGTVVLASHAQIELDLSLSEASESPVELPSILESLGLPDVRFQAIDKTWNSDASSRETEDGSLSEEIFESFQLELTPPDVVAVQCSGTLADWQESIRHLALPAENQSRVVWGKTKPVGRIFYETEEQEEHTVAAVFGVGQGNIVVAAEGFFRNRFLPMEDNAVAAAYLLMSPADAPVVFDEFYHGLGVRGNPLYLLTLPGYLAVALGLLLVIGLMSWRKAILLGPPLTEKPQSRRDIGEYIAAMGQFFSRGRSSRRFLIEHLREGVLRELNIAFALPPDAQDIDLVLNLLNRKNPERAKRVRETLADAERLLQSRSRLTEQQTLTLMRRLTACL